MRSNAAKLKHLLLPGIPALAFFMAYTPHAAKLKHLLLPGILVLAFFMAYIPHLEYPYPVHLDEWLHLGYARTTMETGSIQFADPFISESIVGVESPDLEAGFQLLWGTLQLVTGISWPDVFRYFPAVVFMVTVLSVYALANKEGAGLEAAFFTCLIPTTVGILGPGFLVPVATGLLFIPLSLLLIFHFRTLWSYLLLFLFMSFLVGMHAPTAVGLILIVAPSLLLTTRSNLRHNLGVAFALGLPFAAFPWIFDLVLPFARRLLIAQPLSEYVQIPRILQVYGLIPVVLTIIGVFAVTVGGRRRHYGLVLGFLVILLVLASSFTFDFGPPILYYRSLLYMMLLASILAGIGLAAIRRFSLPRIDLPGLGSSLVPYFGTAACLAIVVATLAIAVPARIETPYYRMIDEHDYEAFLWIDANISDDYDKAILDPWKATAFGALTDKTVYSRIHSHASAKDLRAYEFLADGCMDTAFLRKNNLTIVYARDPCSNPALTEVRENVYLLLDEGQ